MRKTLLISFPRSGHHMLVRVLKQYFKGDLKYTESYTEPRTEDHNLVKSHDFKLDEDPGAFEAVIVLHRRNVARALLSYFKFQFGPIWETSPVGLDTFSRWVVENLAWRDKWVDRWVTNGPEHRKVFIYDRLIAEPVKALEAVIRHMEPEYDVDLPRLRDALEEEKVAPTLVCDPEEEILLRWAEGAVAVWESTKELRRTERESEEETNK